MKRIIFLITILSMMFLACPGPENDKPDETPPSKQEQEEDDQEYQKRPDQFQFNDDKAPFPT